MSESGADDLQTIVGRLFANARSMPDRPALSRRRVAGWESLSWADYARDVRRVAAGLAALGAGPGEMVGVLSGNRLEWHLADLGIMTGGGVTVPVYATSSPPQVAYMLDFAGVRVCFVENGEMLARVLAARDDLPKLERLVLFEDDIDDAGDGGDGADSVLTFQDLLEMGDAFAQANPDEIASRTEALRPETLATLVYTSGTTGPPKAAMIDHGNIAWTVDALSRIVPDRDPGQRMLSFLPLSHIVERMGSDFLCIALGWETWFAGSLATVPEDLQDCRPTAFFAVPRVWQKLHQRVAERVAETSGMRGRLARRYLGLVDAVAEERVLTAFDQLARRVLDRLVGSTIRRQLGLDKATYLISGAAPIHPALLRWFHAVGLPVAEGYGLTETCAPATLNPPDRIKVGTVGPAVPGVEVRLGEDGEVLVRGRNVIRGYLRRDEATRELLDDEGFAHTGDLGRFDADGYLSIVGRKKDLIITAAGKNIAPQEIESALEGEDLVSHAVVLGEGRKYLTALLTIDADAARSWAERNGHPTEDVVNSAQLAAELEAVVERANAAHSRAEGIKKWKVLPHDFTIGRELTPTLKVKRDIVNETYAGEIEALYRDD